jgi:hypothetical protein
MRGKWTLTNLLVMFVFAPFLAVFPLKTPAQCFAALPELGPINGLTGIPFQAEVKRTFLPENSSLMRNNGSGPRRVARDSQGRIRTEWSGGMYKVQNGPDAGTEEEQLHVTICDPVKGESISLDTLNKTATVQKVPFARAPLSTLPTVTSPPSFCSRQFHVAPTPRTTEVADLGHRTIEGMDAQGVLQRQTIRLHDALNGGASAPPRELINVSETWCSEELGAVILLVMGTEEKGRTNTVAMVNIQRGEPDETLFEIPPGYRIAERVNDPATRTGQGMVGSFGVGSSAGQIIIPDKP